VFDQEIKRFIAGWIMRCGVTHGEATIGGGNNGSLGGSRFGF